MAESQVGVGLTFRPGLILRTLVMAKIATVSTFRVEWKRRESGNKFDDILDDSICNFLYTVNEKTKFQLLDLSSPTSQYS